MPPPYGWFDCAGYREPLPISDPPVPEPTPPPPGALPVATPASVPDGGTRLVIVESPAKARTIAGYLGAGYVVESSIGHIRDLPHNAAEVPAKYKGQPWARLGVDVDNGFEPVYVVPPDKKSHMAKLKKLLKDADELYLATDEDREGEAIAWHLYDELKPRVPVHRMVFHEITPAAIRAAVDSPREHRPGTGRRPGDATHPRPPVRLRGQPGAVEEGHVRAVGRPRAVGGDPAGRRPRARSDRVPPGRLLGPAGDHGRRRRRRAAPVPGPPGDARRHPGRERSRLHLPRRAGRRSRGGPPRRATVRCARRPGLRDQPFTVVSVEAKPYTRRPVPTVPYHHAAAGGQPQARLRRLGDDADRPAPVRERLHHLHAHRLGDAVPGRHRRGTRPGT